MARLFLTAKASKARGALAAAALSAALGACAYPYNPVEAPLPQERHQIVVREARATVEVPIAQGRGDLSFGEVAEIRALTRQYMDQGHGPIVIALPVGGLADDRAVEIGADIRDLIYDQGVAYQDIQGAAYDAETPDAPLVVMVDYYLAEAPDCHQRWDNLARVNNGGNTLNFGCAVRANIAAVVTDPADLLGPREQSSPDAIRRGEVLVRYRTGQTTTTQRGDNEGVAVSDAVE